MAPHLAAKEAKTTMASITTLLNETEERVNFLRTTPLDYIHNNLESEIEKTRDQTNKLSLEKAKLMIERDRL